MNSEELEKSLRSEFENYLKDMVAEMRQSVSDFQEKINADFDKHKEQLEESMRELNEKFGGEKELEVSFIDSVTEHLKLARDEGARITATAFAEAEKMDEGPEAPDFSDLGNAIADISSKDSQSEILKALVTHASEYTPRGAFFIVKNEHLVGWRVFGREDHEDPKAVREVFFPVDSHTVLSEAVNALGTVSETDVDSEDDVMYRNKLGFQNPSQMYAVPLIARGRGVAVLYADDGESGEEVNIAAIESLMRVAGLTVEVLASAPPVAPVQDEQEAPAAFPAEEPAEEHFAEPAEEEAVEQPAEPQFEDVEEFAEADAADEFDEGAMAPDETAAEESYQFEPIQPAEADFEAPADTAEFESGDEAAVAEDTSFEQVESYDDSIAEYDAALEAEEVEVEGQDAEESVEPDTFAEEPSWDEAPAAESDSFEVDQSFTAESEPTEEPATAFDSFESEGDTEFAASEPAQQNEYEFEPAPDAAADTEYAFDSPVAEADTMEPEFDETTEEPAENEYMFEQPAEETFEAAPEVDEQKEAAEQVPAEAEADTAPVEEQPQEAAAPPVRSRFADRNLDLPIEVGESERRLHNDARRFARLLVSEIKLYNEQKVKEGRESSDLYERLREAIDRSREMYDKRVQPPVAAKFDYFNYELVNTLAEGDEGKLGGSYPGPST